MMLGPKESRTDNNRTLMKATSLTKPTAGLVDRPNLKEVRVITKNNVGHLIKNNDTNKMTTDKQYFICRL